MNGDGYDDLLISAWHEDEGGDMAGQVYLILGKPSGWRMDTHLSQADASFIGEQAEDQAGYRMASGDVNRDGYDDILIGAVHNSEGGTRAGQVYLIFGKPSGWRMDMHLSDADASFIGEDAYSYVPKALSVGDVNRDGYDDILIGAYGVLGQGNEAGQVYLVLGKSSGWRMDTDLSVADASFMGEDAGGHAEYGKDAGDYAGHSVAGGGDVNGDGCDDLLIGAYFNDEGGYQAGQTYLVLSGCAEMETERERATSRLRRRYDDNRGFRPCADKANCIAADFDPARIGPTAQVTHSSATLAIRGYAYVALIRNSSVPGTRWSFGLAIYDQPSKISHRKSKIAWYNTCG